VLYLPLPTAKERRGDSWLHGWSPAWCRSVVLDVRKEEEKKKKKMGPSIARFLIALCLAFTLVPRDPPANVVCGQTITEDTTLTADLVCPPGTDYGIVLGASGITLDLGGHRIRGNAPGVGIVAPDCEGVVIRNGTIEGWSDGIFLYYSPHAVVEDLVVTNQDVIDPEVMIVGVHVEGSQDVAIRDTLFAFPPVAHKEAVQTYFSDVAVSHVEVHGGGAGVNFSFANVCDPVGGPNTGTVTDSTFCGVTVGAVYVACTAGVLVSNNVFTNDTDDGVGILAEAPFPGASSGLAIEGNTFRGYMMAIEFRGITQSTISDNNVTDNLSWGIMLRWSFGCMVPMPGWDCFYSTGNLITGNVALRNGIDLYHDEGSLGNIWDGNTCQTKEGVEIPECVPPATLVANYASGRPGSFFTLAGTGFPADSTATVAVNGTVLGTVPTDTGGNLVFLLSTGQAGEGHYTVNAAVNPSAPAMFVLDVGEPLRPQEGEGPVFDVPAGLAYTELVYLPLIERRGTCTNSIHPAGLSDVGQCLPGALAHLRTCGTMPMGTPDADGTWGEQGVACAR
jgi:hypothetical protein